MHKLKEDFRDIFESTVSWGDSIIKLLDWMYDALSYFPKSLGTMVRWFGTCTAISTAQLRVVLSNELIINSS